jgi:hypothetical protein
MGNLKGDFGDVVSIELQNLRTARGTLKVVRIVPTFFETLRCRFEQYRTADAPWKNDKKKSKQTTQVSITLAILGLMCSPFLLHYGV